MSDIIYDMTLISVSKGVNRKILENNYDKRISSMNILVLHSKYDTYCHLKVPKMEEEALFLIKNAQLKK